MLIREKERRWDDVVVFSNFLFVQTQRGGEGWEGGCGGGGLQEEGLKNRILRAVLAEECLGEGGPFVLRTQQNS